MSITARGAKYEGEEEEEGGGGEQKVMFSHRVGANAEAARTTPLDSGCDTVPWRQQIRHGCVDRWYCSSLFCQFCVSLLLKFYFPEKEQDNKAYSAY